MPPLPQHGTQKNDLSYNLILTNLRSVLLFSSDFVAFCRTGDRKDKKQECIPVGCVPPAFCPYLPACTAGGGEGYLPEGVYLVLGGVPGPREVYLVSGLGSCVLGPRGCTCRGCTWSWGVYLPRGVYLPKGVYLPGGVPAQGVGIYLPGGGPARGVPAQRCTCPGGTCPGTPPCGRNDR